MAVTSAEPRRRPPRPVECRSGLSHPRKAAWLRRGREPLHGLLRAVTEYRVACATLMQGGVPMSARHTLDLLGETLRDLAPLVAAAVQALDKPGTRALRRKLDGAFHYVLGQNGTCGAWNPRKASGTRYGSRCRAMSGRLRYGRGVSHSRRARLARPRHRRRHHGACIREHVVTLR